MLHCLVLPRPPYTLLSTAQILTMGTAKMLCEMRLSTTLKKQEDLWRNRSKTNFLTTKSAILHAGFICSPGIHIYAFDPSGGFIWHSWSWHLYITQLYWPKWFQFETHLFRLGMPCDNNSFPNMSEPC